MDVGQLYRSQNQVLQDLQGRPAREEEVLDLGGLDENATAVLQSLSPQRKQKGQPELVVPQQQQQQQQRPELSMPPPQQLLLSPQSQRQQQTQLMAPVPQQQQGMPSIGAHQLPARFLVEQTLSYAAPYQHILSDTGTYGTLSNTPSLTRFQPSLVHQIGPDAAAAQQLEYARQLQRLRVLQPGVSHGLPALSEDLLLPTAADGTIISSIGAGVARNAASTFYSLSRRGALPDNGGHAAAGGSGGGSAEAGNEKGKAGSAQSLGVGKGGCPTLSTFDQLGGLLRVSHRQRLTTNQCSSVGCTDC